MKPFNRLTPAEAERLALLAEECAEVIQVVGKVLRHGYESRHPGDPAGPTNRGLLAKECGDVLYAMGLMINCRDLMDTDLQFERAKKAKSVTAYLHHQAKR